METKLTALKLPLELHKKIKEIALREGRDMQEIFKEQLEKYVKEHGDGNPVYNLDHFQQKDFRICPAYFSNFDKWTKYFTTLNHKERVEFETQFQVIQNSYNRCHRENKFADSS